MNTGRAQLLSKPRCIGLLRFIRNRLRVDTEIAQIRIRHWFPDLPLVQCDCFVQIGKCLGASFALTCHAHTFVYR